MVEYFVSSTDYEVREFRAVVNKIVMRMGVSEGQRGWSFKGYDGDGDAVFEIQDTVAPKLVEIAKGLGAKCYKSDTSQMGKSQVVDRR